MELYECRDCLQVFEDKVEFIAHMHIVEDDGDTRIIVHDVEGEE